MERLDIHVALEVCEIVIESATLVPIVFGLSAWANYVAQSPLAPLTRNADRALALWGCPSISSRPRISIHRLLFGLIEKFTHFHQYLVKFRYVHLSNRLKNDTAINCEKSLRTNEALVRELSVFKIGAIQGNGESIEMRAAGDLAENQILAWKIFDHQSGPTLSAGGIGPRKKNDDNFAGYRFDHAASSCGEFQSSARTDSLSSAPLNASSRAFLFRRIAKS
jgi:hypothetical protein